MADKIQTNFHFLQLLFSFQASAMQQLGKVMNPMTQKIERNLDGAKYTIDLLMALREKTKGNCSEEEKVFLDRVIYELQMNYADEVEADKKAEKAESEDKAEAGEPESKENSEPEAETNDKE